MKIIIKKGIFGVPMVIRQSFSFNTRSYGSHRAEVMLAKDGEYNLTIDGSAYSLHDGAAKRSPLYKDAIVKVSKEMLQAIVGWNNAYIYLSKKTLSPKSRTSVENQLNKLAIKQYKREPFTLPIPRKGEVAYDLQQEANFKFFSLWSRNSSKKSSFVSDTLEEEFNERMSNWEELKLYHETIQSCVEAQTNESFLREYNESKKALEDELYGDDTYVKQQISALNVKLDSQIPFDITLDVDYNKEGGIINAIASLPSMIYVPDKKAVPLSSGKISIKDKLKKELDTDTVNTLLGISYYLAGHLFNLSVNVSLVRLSVVTGFSAYYWVEFDRKSFSAISFSSLYPLQDFFSHPNVIDYKKSTIEIIPESDFRKRIDDVIKTSALLASNPNLILLPIGDAEKISKIISNSEDLKQAIKEAKATNSLTVIVDKRYRNVLNEVDDIEDTTKPQKTNLQFENSSFKAFNVDPVALYERARQYMNDFYAFMDLLSVDPGVNRHDNLNGVQVNLSEKMSGDGDTSTYRGKLFFCSLMDFYRIIKNVYKVVGDLHPYCYPFALVIFKIYTGKEVPFVQLSRYESVYRNCCNMLKPTETVPVPPHILFIADILYDYKEDQSWYNEYLSLISRFLKFIKDATDPTSVYSRNLDDYINTLRQKGLEIIL
jgi:hypothetical protein